MGTYGKLMELNQDKKAQKREQIELEKIQVDQAASPIQSSLVREPKQMVTQKDKTKFTSKMTRERDILREIPSDNSRKKLRGNQQEFPTRDEIQEFSFRLRDTLKVKVQAEVPHEWQDELEEIARQLDVKKLELYRYMIGEFLGKVKRKRAA